MQNNLLSRQRTNEKGQTIVLVAISLVSLLAMAALAIDVVTLYVARTETQRAADAAALAGAKAIADSGITTFLVTDPTFTAIQPWAKTRATDQINVVRQNNLVAGSAPTLASLPSFTWSQGNPHVTVKLTSPNLSTLFAKIWGAAPNNVTAAATAEVYNPANLDPTTPFTPIAPRSVKPWLVANVDPTGTAANFVNTATWAVDSGVVGKSFDLVSDCTGIAVPCGLIQNPPGIPPLTTGQVQYVPALVTPNSANVCPTSVGSCNSSCAGASAYELSVECADVNSYSFVNCGGGATNLTWNTNENPGGAAGDSANGAQCLIHATGPGSGTQQDTLSVGLWPAVPMQITGGTCSVNPGQVVANSSSVVTIPVIDNTTALVTPNGSVTVVGFLQAFINQVDVGGPSPAPPAGSINITVLNIVGCSATNNGANPVIGGSGTSPIPVRLISPP